MCTCDGLDKFKLRGGRHHICNGDLQVPTSPAYSALRDPGSAGVWNGKILKKYKSRDESRDLYFSEARSVWKRAAIAERAV